MKDDVTCGNTCTALVRDEWNYSYGKQCDRYCESFGHICVAAATDDGNSCNALETFDCSTRVGEVSKMLCTCRKPAGKAFLNHLILYFFCVFQNNLQHYFRIEGYITKNQS